MKKEKELEKIIEYFKLELDLINREYNKSVEDRKFNFNISILLLSAFIVLISAFIQVFLSPTWIISFPEILNYIKYFIGFLLLVVLYSIGHHSYYEWKDYKFYLNKKIPLEIILKFLTHLKLVDYEEKDLDILIKRIKLDFRDYRKASVTTKKEYEEFQENRLDEYARIMDKINSEIIIRENKDDKK